MTLKLIMYFLIHTGNFLKNLRVTVATNCHCTTIQSSQSSFLFLLAAIVLL